MNLKKLTLGQIFVLAFIVLFIIPLIIIRLYFISASYESSKIRAADQLDYAATRTADKIDGTLAVPIEFMRALASVAEKKPLDDGHIEALINSFPLGLPMVSSVYLLDDEKKIIYSSTGGYKNVSADDLHGVQLYGIVQDQDGVHVSEPFLSPVSNTSVVRVSMPFDGGYVAADVDMGYIRDLLKKNMSNKHDLVRIVTDKSEVIASTSQSFFTDNVSNNPLMKIKNSEAILSNFDDGGIKYLGTVRKVASADWYILYESPLTEAFAFYFNIFKAATFSLVFLGLFAVTTLLFIRQKLIRPLKKLTRISEMIADDNYDGFDEKNSTDFKELEALYVSFEKMSKKIDQRERDLRNSEAFLRSILDSTTSTGIVTLSMDSEPVITEINRGATNIFGYSFKEILGVPASALINGLKNDLDSMCQESRITDRVVTKKIEMMKKDGTVFPALCSVCPLLDFQGRVNGFICSSVDITDLTDAQNELYAEKERLDVTLRSIGEGVVAADRNGQIILVNSAAEDMLGQEQRFFMGHNVRKSLKIFDLATGESLSEYISDFSSGHTNNISARLGRKDGKNLFVYITSSLIKNHDGTILGSVYVFMNITERMLMENELISSKKQLERINTDLEKRVSDETEKRRRNEQILFEQARFASMGQMISAIAHQWRQPLNALALYVQDIEDEYNIGALSKDYIHKYIEGSMRLINHMSYTIDDFRNFFHSGTSAESCDILLVINETLSLIVPQLRNENIHYRLSVTAEGQTTVFDDRLPENDHGLSRRRIKILKNELKQVVLNIVQNAKYACDQARKAGHISNCLIGIDIIYLEDSVRVNIFNNGDKIPEEVIGSIFDPYFTTKPEGEGTGIGLYMSKIIIEEHMKGSLTAGNIEDGAMFSLTFGGGLE